MTGNNQERNNCKCAANSSASQPSVLMRLERIIVISKNKTAIFIPKTIIRKKYYETMPNNKNILDIWILRSL